MVCNGFLLSTIFQRQTYKYGERGLRYALLDAGHVLGAIEFAAHRIVRQLWQGLGAYAWRVGVKGGNTTTGAS